MHSLPMTQNAKVSEWRMGGMGRREEWEREGGKEREREREDRNEKQY